MTILSTKLGISVTDVVMVPMPSCKCSNKQMTVRCRNSRGMTYCGVGGGGVTVLLLLLLVVVVVVVSNGGCGNRNRNGSSRSVSMDWYKGVSK